MARVAMVFALACMLVGAMGAGPAGKPEPLRVVVTVAPLKGLVEPLLPEGSTVKVLMQPGKSEHGYEFTPADIVAVAKADLVVYVGLGLDSKIEATLKKREFQPYRIVCLGDAVGIKAGEHEEGEKDEHAAGHEHPGDYVDPHVWVDPVLVVKAVPKLKDAVQAVLSWKCAGDCLGTDSAALHEQMKHADEAAKDLTERVEAVDREWRDRLAPFKGKSVVTHHNAFSRPAERYGFKVAAVIREFETSEPSPGDVAKVVEAIRKEKVKTIFVEPQFNATAAERIAARAGVKVGHLDPLGDGDWFKMMRSNLDALVSGLSDGQAGEKPAVQPGGAGGK